MHRGARTYSRESGRCIVIVFVVWCWVGSEHTVAQSTAPSTFFTEHIIEKLDANIKDGLATDLDDDGDLDVVFFLGDPVWFENLDGRGNFGNRRFIGDGTGPRGTRGGLLIAIDLNGDGKMDILSRESFYENLDGNANSFAEPVSLYEGLGVSEDFDMDGDQDLLMLREDLGEIGWYENTDGAIGFSEFKSISSAVVKPERVHAADLDGDGYPDALSASSVDDKVAWYRNKLGEGDDFSEFGAQQVITESANGASDVKTGDLDEDGDLDVVSASPFDDTVAWFQNTDGKGSFSEKRIVTESANGVEWLRIADIDIDGDLDIVAGTRFGGIILWYENLDGQGTFGPAHEIGHGEDNATSSLFVGDLDGDGDIDVGGSFANGDPGDKIVWYENQCSNPPNDCIGTPVEVSPEVPTAEDFVFQNYPNPFLNRTTISLVLDKPDYVSIRIHDLLGRTLEKPIEKFLPAGRHEFNLDARNLPVGMLFVSAQTSKTSVVRQIVHLK